MFVFPCSADHEQDWQQYPVDLQHSLVPSLSETSFRGMSMGGSFRRVWGRDHPRKMQPTGCLRDSADRLRRGGGMGLRTVFPGARLFRAPIWCPSGGGATREAGSTVAESLVALYRVCTHLIRQGRKAARSPTSQGNAEPLCTRIKGANWEGSEGKDDLITVCFLPTRADKERRTGKIRGAFSGMHRALGGWMLARAPVSSAQGLRHHGPRYFNFSYFCIMCGFEKLGLIDQN